MHIYWIYMICKHILLITFVNELHLIFSHTVKWFQVLLCNTIYFIQYYSFAKRLNGFKYCYVSLIIQLNISHLFTLLHDQSVLFLTIQFSVSHLSAHCLNSSFLPIDLDPIWCYHSRSQWTWEQWICTLHSLNLLQYLSPAIRLITSYPRHRCSWCILQPPQPTFYSFRL